MNNLLRSFLSMVLAISSIGLATAPARADGCADPMTLSYDLSLLGGGLEIVLPLGQITGSAEVNWGDGNIETAFSSGTFAHTYASSDTYNISICGGLNKYGQSSSTPVTGVAALTAVTSFGDLPLVSFQNAFAGATNLTDVPSSIPTTITNLSGTFRGATSFNDSDVSLWDVSNVTDMSYMFYNASSFNQDIGIWNTSSMTTFIGIFRGAAAFNNGSSDSINGWDTSGISDLYHVFYGASSFNQNIGGWDVSNVVAMSYAFANATAFNNGDTSGISNWNVGKVTNFTYTFWNATSFDQPVGDWDLGANLGASDRIGMVGMFKGATSFNQPLGWNTSKVNNFNTMFEGATAFDQNIGGWDISNGISFEWMFFGTNFNNGGSSDINNWGTFAAGAYLDHMFRNAYKFNQPLNLWNTGNVISMANMFDFATSFDQDISGWDYSGVITNGGGGIFPNSYDGNLTLAFVNSGFSTVNYDKLLIALADNLQDPWDVTGLVLGGDGRKYTCNAVDARAALVTAGMTINDAGLAAVPAPTLTTANPRDGGVDLWWNAAACNGTPVTVIRNEISFNNGSTWQTAAGTNTWVTAGGMINGTEYQIRVRVVTADGTSPASNMLTVVPQASEDVELFVVPDDQTIEAGTTAPGSGFYTYTLRTGSTSGTVVTPTLTSAPVCTSSYNASMTAADSPLTITCSGGSATGYTFNVTDTAVLTITDPAPEPINLYVVPDNQSIEIGSPIPSDSFYTYIILNGAFEEVSPTLTSAPVCTSTYNPSMTYGDFPVEITCSGGSAVGYNFITFAQAQLQLPDDDLEPESGSTFTVTYDANGAATGFVPIPAALVSQFGSYEVLSNFGGLTKPGFVFAGWTDGIRSYLPGDFITVRSNLKLSAVWLANTGKMGTFTPIGVKKTQISWSSIEGALVYRVLVNGKVVYSGNATEYAHNKLLGPASEVKVEVETAAGIQGYDLDLVAGKRFKLAQVSFAAGSSRIGSAMAQKLDGIVKLIKKQGFNSFTSIGYSDSTTSSATKLAKARAKAVNQYLKSKGLTGKFVVKRITDESLAKGAVLWIVS